MRVIAGEARSLKLIAPKGIAVRPTTDRTKETLFNMIGPFVQGAIFLDIFSGSGAIGIEAISRGARKAVFIEQATDSIDCIQKNLEHTKLKDRSEILKMDCIRALNSLSAETRKMDIIFLDPPYNKGFEETVITAIGDLKLLAEGGMIVCESSEETNFNFVNQLEDLRITKTKSFKTNKFTFIEGKLK